jgi:CHAT domain-containing protein/Tfp pilus assembly protein PilF
LLLLYLPLKKSRGETFQSDYLMNSKKQILRFVVLCIFIYKGVIDSPFIIGAVPAGNFPCVYIPVFSPDSFKTDLSSLEIKQLNDSLYKYLDFDDLVKARRIVEILLKQISGQNIDDAILQDSYYFIGIYHLKVKECFESARYLSICAAAKERNEKIDQRYERVLYNLSLTYLILGDLNKFEYYAAKSLETGKRIFGNSSPELVTPYLSLLTAYVELNDFEKAIKTSNLAIDIVNSKPDSVPASVVAIIYENTGVCYHRMGNFSKARIYYDKAESIFGKSAQVLPDSYINIMANLASTYSSLGLFRESEAYYEKGVRLAISANSPFAFTIINNYSIYLANNKKTEKGEKLLESALDRAKVLYKNNPRDYYEVLNYYASYLRANKIDLKKSIESYEKCYQYLKDNEQVISLRNSVFVGYARALEDTGEPGKALMLLQSLLYPDNKNRNNIDNYNNPALDSLKPDIVTLKLLKLKYSILLDIYKAKKDLNILEAASNTSELVVAMLDKIRINISEDESRLILGDKYRDSYLNAIHDFNLLYTLTADHKYLEKAFEYSEKSKVAGLLTATRELKATQFHIPSNIAAYELELQKEISLLNIRISDESNGKKPNQTIISEWKEGLLQATRKRDSLIVVFEKQYPDYYAIKYNTRMIGLKEIPDIIGKDGNYINYIVSDTMLYTFVVNRRTQQLFSTPVDTSFISDIKHFRQLLSMPMPSDNAALKFKEFQIVGYRLYKILIDPVKSSLISDKLFISPDNILSYLPFETIPSNPELLGALKYRDISYLMNTYDISYTYSVTFMAEYIRKEYKKRNTLIAFAPSYPEPIDIQKVLMSRQATDGVLNDLPYARQEAEFVTELTGGKLYENSEAKESVYKQESGNYDIIHLSMHTLMNDTDPMHSTLIFSHLNDSIDDGYLKTFEIYGIPLKAKMVVLSSCNTGSGRMSSGEGILSLARGFIYSGSQSVVMSLWEIEDKSGTEIVEKFYRNLKNGYSKSASLKKARIEFLNSADQLRSHPYFWSTLVVYGNNEPLYYSKKLKFAILAIGIIISLSLMYYFSRRKYS